MTNQAIIDSFEEKYITQYYKGAREYGGPLHPFKVDTADYAIEEVVDLFVYLKTLEAERYSLIEIAKAFYESMGEDAFKQTIQYRINRQTLDYLIESEMREEYYEK